METNFLYIKNVLDGGWEIPWSILVEVTRIKTIMKDVNALVKHTKVR